VDVPVWVWALTLCGLVAVLGTDLLLGIRNPRPVTARAALPPLVAYVGLAAGFGIGLWVFAGAEPAAQFGAGYLLEYSLSVDNLFVYMLVMSSFAVPPTLRSSVLLFGVGGTLLLRGPFIAGGVAAVDHFTATFYVFGAVLLWTAIGLLRGGNQPAEVGDNIAVRVARRLFPTTAAYAGHRLFVRENGRRYATPMLLVVAAVSMTGLVFALDSIPAIFGVTTDAYVIVAANAFALMGLRQLYFVIGDLLARLRYLSTGLAVVLGFIAVKLVLGALRSDGVDWAPEVGVGVSLGCVVGVLGVTVVVSLVSDKVRGS
jgi:TerC family integral membrane protein